MTTFNPAAEHRCSRCGQWWWSTHTCPDQLGRVVPPPRFAQGAPIEVTTTDKIAAERDALRDEVERLRTACSRENDTISQVLGRALGYPRFADDQKNFPGATDADGVCVGDHVAASLADEAANTIRTLRSAVESLTQQLKTGESFHAVAVQQRDAAWREVESLRADAQRYRWIASSCRITGEHWGGRWSIVVEGPVPKRHDDEEHFDAAIDVARAAQEGKT